MRLREYLEIKDGLKSKLREDYDDNDDEDYVELEDAIDLDFPAVRFHLHEAFITCDRCEDQIDSDDPLDKFENIYGETLCEYCWDQYMNSIEALAEYVRWIANGDIDISDFSQEELDDMAASWKDNKGAFSLTPAEITKIENKARAEGFIF